MEFKRPTGDFNLNALPSDEKWRKLMYMATSGSDVMHTPFETIINGETKQEIQKRKDRESYERITVAIASRERITEFGKELKRLDEASMAALLESEEKLRAARKELSQIRERAYELTQPDGSVTKVYRDGNIVRADDGGTVNPQLIKPEDIPDSLPTWQQRKSAGDAVRDAQKDYDAVVNYRDQLSKAQKRIDQGDVSNDELDAMKADLDQMPSSVYAHYDQRAATTVPARPNNSWSASDQQLKTDAQPGHAFATAASGKVPAPVSDNSDFKALPPSAGLPAPG